MGINTHERFENHMDVSSPETIGDAEKIEDFHEDNDTEDEFDKRISDAESVKGLHSEMVTEDDKPNIEKDENASISHDEPILANSAHCIIDLIKNKNKQDLMLEIEDVTQEELTEIAPLENIDIWIKDVNPNFDEFDYKSPYCNNCGSCAYAVYQRLEGNSDICATSENIGYNSEMEALTGMRQVSMSPQEIEECLLSEGNGAHAIIGIDRAEGAGHWFNAACIGDKVIAIDGQDGSISEWPPDYGNVVNWEMSIRKETNNE